MDTSLSMSSSPMQRPLMEAIIAIENTRRWSEDFVRKLGLCLWAGSSLNTIGAIRYWVQLVGCDDDAEMAATRMVLDAMGGSCKMSDIFFTLGSGKLTMLASQSHSQVISPCDCVAKTASSPQQWGNNNIAGVNMGEVVCCGLGRFWRFISGGGNGTWLGPLA